MASTETASGTAAAATPPPRLRLPIAVVLMAGFGLLILAAVAAVLLLGLVSASRNTLALLGENAELALSAVSVRVRHQLDPARDQGVFLAELIARGELDLAHPQRMIDTFRGALAATPQVTGIMFTDPQLNAVRVGRLPEGIGTFSGNLLALPPGSIATEDVARLRSALVEARYRPYPFWADPVWSAGLHRTLVSVRVPVLRDGTFFGLMLVAVSLGDLSRFLSELYLDTGISAVLLFDERHVLAHPALTRLDFDFSGTGAEPPLPRIDQLDDPVLAAFRDDGETFELTNARHARPITGRIVDVGGESHLFLLGDVPSYGSRPWTVAIMTRVEDVNTELRRLAVSGLTGLGILLVSVALALLLGRAISRRIGRLEAAAVSLRDLDFRNAPLLPRSRFRELDNAAAAFNTMVRGLRWFETYVPKALVLRLIRLGARDGLVSEQRAVTVMFTDIRGFSRLSQCMDAAQIATLLNRHFTLLADCIEAECGTVDKFIGDAVMAFWGAPEEQPDHAARALAAARAIAAALHEDNLCRAAAGEEPIRMRVALHSGPVVVGNIGSASRLNYTIVGDTVNTAARIEELAAALQQQEEEETLILASGTTVAAAATAAGPVRSIGRRELRGRAGAVEVFRVEAGTGAGAPEATSEAGSRATVS